MPLVINGICSTVSAVAAIPVKVATEQLVCAMGKAPKIPEYRDSVTFLPENFESNQPHYYQRKSSLSTQKARSFFGDKRSWMNTFFGQSSNSVKVRVNIPILGAFFGHFEFVSELRMFVEQITSDLNCNVAITFSGKVLVHDSMRLLDYNFSTRVENEVAVIMYHAIGGSKTSDARSDALFTKEQVIEDVCGFCCTVTGKQLKCITASDIKTHRFQVTLDLENRKDLMQLVHESKYRTYHHILTDEYLVFQEQSFSSVIGDMWFDTCEIATIFGKCVSYVGRTIWEKLAKSKHLIESAIMMRVRPKIISLVESTVLLAVSMLCAESRAAQLAAIGLFIKERTGKSLYDHVMDNVIYANFHRIFDESDRSVLAEQSVEQVLVSARMILTRFKEVREFPIWKKIYKFVTVCLSLDLFSGMGIDFKTLRFSKLEEAALRRANKNPLDCLEAICDCALYLCEAGWQVIKTGDYQCLYHCGSSYEKWFDTCTQLRVRKVALNGVGKNEEDRFRFLADLEECVEKGENILQHARRLKDKDMKYVAQLLADMQIMLADETTKREALKSRRAPLGVLIYGTSSIGKSTFQEMMFHQYAKVFGLQDSEEFKYTRCPEDEYWSGFRSYQWCVVLDDIAYKHPDKAADGDKSVGEIIQIVNNVPLIPPQAELADKGRTPVRCDLVLGSTNKKDMNAFHYYQTPAAVQRRLPFIISVKVKPEFRRPGTNMLDSQKAAATPLVNGEWPDYWTVRVEEVRVIPNDPTHVATLDVDGMTGRDEDDEPCFDNTDDFLAWFSSIAKAHRKSQDAVERCVQHMRDIPICKGCYRTLAKCTCVKEEEEDEHFYDSISEEDNVSLLPQNDEDMLHFANTESLQDYLDNSFNEICPKDLKPALVSVLKMAFKNAFMELQRRPNDVKAFRHYRDTCVMISLMNKQRNVADFEQASDDDLDIDELIAQQERNAYTFKDHVMDCYDAVRTFAITRICGVQNFALGLSQMNLRNTMENAKRGLLRTWSQGRDCLRRLGERVEKSIGVRPIHLVAIVAVLAGGIVATASLIKAIRSFTSETFTNNGETQSVPLQKIGVTPVAHDEKENPWKKDQWEMSTFDTSAVTRSWSRFDENEVVKQCQNNVFGALLHRTVDGQRYEGHTGVFGVAGHVYCMNRHALKFGDDNTVELSLKRTTDDQGINTNVKVILRPGDIMYEEGDLVFFHVYEIPPVKDLTSLFFKPTFSGIHNGFILGRDRFGRLWRKDIASAYAGLIQRAGDSESVLAWRAKAREETVKGDCGALWVFMTPVGPVLGGIHSAGCGNIAASERMSEQLVKKVVAMSDIVVMEPNEPALSAPGFERKLRDLDIKSPLRFIPQGNAQVFGSFVGSRSAPKSRVRSTMIRPYVQEKKGAVAFGAPVMHGWEPWHVALKGMVDLPNKIVKERMMGCVDAFTHDILEGLTDEDMKELQVYDLATAVNGAPGVAFVDSINRKSSMGAPWNHTKKHHLEPWTDNTFSLSYLLDESDRTPGNDDVMFDKDTIKRIENIIDEYSHGQRYMPVFSGHLKDEALKEKKIKMKKTRVFTGSPADWSIVNRMYTLSFTRVMQKNKFLFEAGPGTNTQSKQWEEIYQYLTQFGTDRMIAGDYAAFDKSMSAFVILCAFRIILNVLRAAGYSLEDLQVVWGIALDTAYPLVDMNGDLVQFFGTNPSGHPLTVIINSLANALYMRYCYVTVHDENCFDRQKAYTICQDFKKHVALITYGDDNIMGVSKLKDFFNHTAIQRILADIGIEYTMADKETESIPFIDISECSFLKRTWLYDEAVGFHLAPLEETSIIKSLSIGVASQSLSKEAHALEILSSAYQEYFQYGKERFTLEAQFIFDVVDNYKLEFYMTKPFETYFPSYDDLYARFFENSKNVVLGRWASPQVQAD